MTGLGDPDRYVQIDGSVWEAQWHTYENLGTAGMLTKKTARVTRSRERSYNGLLSHDGKVRHDHHIDFYVWAVAAIAAELGRPAVVVDAGCGSGYGSRFLRKYGHSVDAFDVSDDAVRFAAIAYGGDPVVASMTSTPYDSASFDAVVASESIEHVSDDGAALREMYRITAPGGLLILTTPNGDLRDDPSEYHEREYTPGEIETAVRAAGWTPVDWNFDFPGWPQHMGVVCRK